MTYLKVVGIIGAPILVIFLLFGLPYIMPHHSQPSDYNNGYSENGFVSGQIVGGNGSVKINIAPMQNAVAATIAPTPTPKPTQDDQYYPPGSKYNPYPSGYVVTPTPTPTPAITINSQYYDENDYVKINGLNTDYIVVPNKQFKQGQTVNLTMTLQNLKDVHINSISGVLTASALAMDNALNTPVLPFTYTTNFIDIKSLDLRKYDSYKVGNTITLPNVPKGTYIVMVNIHGDNGAYCQISQKIKIV